MRIAVPIIFLGLVVCTAGATGIYFYGLPAPPALIKPVEQPAVPLPPPVAEQAKPETSLVKQGAQTEQAPYGVALPPSDTIRVKTETIRRPEDNADQAMGQQVSERQAAAPAKAKRQKKKTPRTKKRAPQRPPQ
jgi:hypothetical protein